MSQHNWPEQLHKQYLTVLDERDQAVERVELAEARIVVAELLIASLEREIVRLENEVKNLIHYKGGKDAKIAG